MLRRTGKLRRSLQYGLLCCGLLGWIAALPVQAQASVQLLALGTGKAVLLIDGKRHVLLPGQTVGAVRWVDRDGDAALLLRIDNRTYRLAPGQGVGLPAAPAAASATGSARLARITSDAAGMYTTAGSIDGQPVDFLLDTGATRVAMNAMQARALGLPFRSAGTPTQVQTASGIAKAWEITLARVRVGEIELRQVQAVVLEGGFPTQVLLGMSFLGRVDLSRQNGLMVLRQNY